MRFICGLALLIGISSCTTIDHEDLLSENAAVVEAGFHPSRMFIKIPADQPEDLRSIHGQTYMQMLPIVGREDIYASVDESRRLGGPTICLPSEDLHSEILTTIADRAQLTRIVIINEAHDQPRHRYFVDQVAEKLHGIGYSVFAAETFSKHISDSDNYVYGQVTDGGYTYDPVFGALIRHVKALGYHLIAYESTLDWSDESMTMGEKVAWREEEQANNLIEHLSGFEEDAKILIHVGYSHAAEVPIPGFDGLSASWMAARIKQKTGIDPLTIDQTTCRSTNEGFEFSINKQRLEPGQFDLVIGQPKPKFYRGRPQWRIDLGQQLIDVPESLRSDRLRVIVEARPVGEPLMAIPVDRVMLWPGENIPLLLNPGKYSLTSYTEGEDSLGTEILLIE